MKVTYLLAFLLIISGCTARVDQNSVRASANIPTAAKVDRVNIEHDSSTPNIYMTIEPILVRINRGENDINIKYKESGKKDPEWMHEKKRLTVNVKYYQEYFLQRQIQITTQLASSLGGVKNFKLLDYNIAKEKNFTSTNKKPNDLGLYLVRASITEANDQVLYKSDKSRIPGIYKDKEVEIKGMVGLDIQVIDPTSGEVIHAFPTQGSYTTKDVSVEGGLLTDFSSSHEVVKSSIDQALRVALNNAANELFQKFSGKSPVENEYE
jgi:hypothetical protein